MRYRHAGYLFAEGAVGIISDTKLRLQTPRNGPSVLRRTLQLEGEIKANTQSGLRSELTRMSRAFLIDGPSSGLLHDDGSQSVHYLPAAGSLTGVKVLKPPSYNKGDPAEYATYRSFNFTLQADYRIIDADPLYDWVEVLSFRGNCGPRKVQVELAYGDPDEQIVNQRTMQFITQSGRAVGLFEYPRVPPAIYKRLLQNTDEAASYETPRPQGNIETLWPVRWQYNMISDRPLNGLPTRR